MADQEAPKPKFHALLIGIDDYPGHQLKGCVNDIDAIYRVLVGPRMGIPESQIRCLVSPVSTTTRTPHAGEKQASAANIGDALTELGTTAVNPGDRVFIYYSGHGKRVDVKAEDGTTFHREALVPDDFASTDPKRFLFDFEVNQLLHAIAQRTTSVTVVLDSCHSAGATRVGDDVAVRTLNLDDDPVGPIDDPAAAHRALGDDERAPGVAAGVDDCHVVAACLAHEYAREGTYDGARHGLLTHAFLAALDAAGDADLHTITWARIWETMHATMTSLQAGQSPMMTGHPGRAVFGGAPVDGDHGMLVVRDGDQYRVGAGTLADVTKHAELAIYGELPRSFPRLDSPEDLDARRGTVRVTRATEASAIATAVAPFAWPTGARARLIKAGDAARLRYAVTPGHPELQIEDSPLLERVESLEAAAVRLEYSVGRWRLTDDEYPLTLADHHPLAPDAAVLCELQPDELELARRVLEHYYAYSRPLRLARRATPQRNGDLQLSVLTCRDPAVVTRAAQGVRPPEAERRNGRYTLASGDKVCFRVRNTGPDPLRVTLFDVAASGRVQKLGDEVIEARTEHLFWNPNKLGEPIAMSPARGRPCGIDRLVAIGRTDVTVELDHLIVKTRFSDLIDAWRGKDAAQRDAGDDDDESGAPLDRWAAAVAVVAIRPG
jgi:caspase domain-containing protein